MHSVKYTIQKHIIMIIYSAFLLTSKIRKRNQDNVNAAFLIQAKVYIELSTSIRTEQWVQMLKYSVYKML